MRRRVIGPRTAVEAAFLAAVPVITGVVLGAGLWTIIAASAVAYLLVVLVEVYLWYDGSGVKKGKAAAAVQEESVVVPSREEPEPPPESAEGPRPAPEHVRALPREQVAPVAAEPEPDPEPERAPLVAVPVPGPEPVLTEAPASAASSTVVPIGVGAAPQRWNLWDLERLSRERTGADPARDEERTFLLMYLREFADADGMLPMDFDGLVRDSFGDLVAAR
jgi:hypothetical protein